MDSAEEKRRLRRHYRKLRAQLSEPFLSRASQLMTGRLMTLPALENADAVFVFVSMPGEPETRPVIEALLAAGKRVIVPRCEAQGQMALVPIGGLDALVESRYGIMEPAAALPGVAIEAIGFAILPALACGLDGSRLGQGGGYYDRFLARYRGAHAVLCFEDFLAPRLPSEPHDHLMSTIVTEKRVIKL